MMYGSYAFADNNPTIVRNDGSIIHAQRNSLSNMDLEGVKYMYYPDVYIRIRTRLVEEREGRMNYHRIYTNEIQIFSDPNFSNPKSLEYPIKVTYEELLRRDPRRNFHIENVNTIVIPAGSSNYSLMNTEEQARYGANGNIEGYNETSLKLRDGMGYNTN